jgi:hypothetical protein
LSLAEWVRLSQHGEFKFKYFLSYNDCCNFFDKLRASRYWAMDRHPIFVGTPILPRPSPIAHIIIKKENKYIQKLGGHGPNSVRPHKIA